MLKRSAKTGLAWLVPDVTGKTSSFSPFSIMLNVGFCRESFSSSKSYSLFLVNWELFIFYHKWVLDFVKCFFNIFCYDHVTFFSLSVFWIALIDFQMLNYPCTPNMNLSWSWCIIIFLHCWTQFVNIL